MVIGEDVSARPTTKQVWHRVSCLPHGTVAARKLRWSHDVPGMVVHPRIREERKQEKLVLSIVFSANPEGRNVQLGCCKTGKREAWAT